MIVIPLTELKNLDSLIKKVEDGEMCIITKEGKPFAELLPLVYKKNGLKRKFNKVKLTEGKTTTEILREERDIR